MVVLSLSIRVWKDEDTYWAEAPWLDQPITGKTWEEIYEIAIRARYTTQPASREPKDLPEMGEPYVDQAAE